MKLSDPTYHPPHTNRDAVRKALVAHLQRFTRQGRLISIEAAPAAFAEISSADGLADPRLVASYKRAIEGLLDDDVLEVRRGYLTIYAHSSYAQPKRSSSRRPAAARRATCRVSSGAARKRARR